MFFKIIFENTSQTEPKFFFSFCSMLWPHFSLSNWISRSSYMSNYNNLNIIVFIYSNFVERFSFLFPNYDFVPASYTFMSLFIAYWQFVPAACVFGSSWTDWQRVFAHTKWVLIYQVFYLHILSYGILSYN